MIVIITVGCVIKSAMWNINVMCNVNKGKYM